MKIKFLVLSLLFFSFSIAQVYVHSSLLTDTKIVTTQSQCCCIDKPCNCNKKSTGGCKTIDNPSNKSSDSRLIIKGIDCGGTDTGYVSSFQSKPYNTPSFYSPPFFPLSFLVINNLSSLFDFIILTPLERPPKSLLA